MSTLTTSLLFLSAVISYSTITVSAVSVSSIVSQYGLTNSYNFTFPDQTLNSADANTWINNQWTLYNKKGVDWGNSDLVFSPDPSTSSSTIVRRQESSTSSSKSSTKSKTSSASTSSTTGTGTSTSTATTSVSSPLSTALNGQPPALRVEYPKGSYSKKTGGTQFYANPLTSSNAKVASSSGNSTTSGQYERMMLSYDVWFPTGYAWNQGGKLPGLRGGPDARGCSGGNETDGTTCFSTRLMWRSGGAGEVYAYIPTSQKGFCSQSQVTCNSDYGTSLARGSFSFVTGQWQTIQLLVVLNEVGTANGIVELWYNGIQALQFQNLVLRTSSNLNSVGGLFFSTFFGGDDQSWATPTDQFTYYRNIQLFAGAGQSNLTGAKATKSSAYLNTNLGVWSILGAVMMGLIGMSVL
ncbi:uncharacterized protein L201_005450 [Kwoniella dendrophila CBS 6074]|uniref:Polysaccharide lyase 14 domain-containing protein n=1 Tax=Kwoniella dendrophila CBS 6074 TaxID=1295534 RepID=A0AAX4K033_9TREE